jgi:hypothetical protein
MEFFIKKAYCSAETDIAENAPVEGAFEKDGLWMIEIKSIKDIIPLIKIVGIISIENFPHSEQPMIIIGTEG